MDLHTKFVSVLIAHDEKESTKPGYNRHAMGIYLQGLQRVESDLKRGVSLRKAILGAFNGRLANKILKAVNEPCMTQEEKRGLL